MAVLALSGCGDGPAGVAGGTPAASPVASPAASSAPSATTATAKAAPSARPGGPEVSADDRYPATVHVGTLPPLRVEVADTPAERSRGLSGREHLPPRTGMMFRYDAPTDAAYWMWDVGFPLSLAWVRDGRVIGTVEMAPCTATNAGDCRTYESPGPVDTVIEARANTFAGVAAGTPVRVIMMR